MNKGLRLLLTLVVLLATAFLIVLQIQRLLNDRTILPPDDFAEYYAAGQLNAQGKNPYDLTQLTPIEAAAGRDTEAAMMWNPPWTLTLAMPFGSMDSRTAQLLWLALGFCFIVFGVDLLWRIFDGPAQKRWIAWLLAFTFPPTLFVLHAGQIGTWIFAGTVLFLYLQKRGWSMLAGAAAVLLAVKPHLVYLFWIALIVWGVRRDRRLLFGELLAGLAATAIPLIFNPDVITQYWEAMTERSPANWMSPTLGTLIRMAVGETAHAANEKSHFRLTFLPTLLGLAWLTWYAWSIKRKMKSDPAAHYRWPDEMPILLLVSFVTASYGAWPFDLVILLPAVIRAAAIVANSQDARLVRLGIGCWLAINVPALLLNVLKKPLSDYVDINSFWFIWMAPAMLAAYLFLIRYRKTNHA